MVTLPIFSCWSCSVGRRLKICLSCGFWLILQPVSHIAHLIGCLRHVIWVLTLRCDCQEWYSDFVTINENRLCTACKLSTSYLHFPNGIGESHENFYLSVYLSICLPVCLSIYILFCRSVILSIVLSFYLSIYHSTIYRSIVLPSYHYIYHSI